MLSDSIFIQFSVLVNVLNFPNVYDFYYNTHVCTVLMSSFPVISTSYLLQLARERKILLFQGH